MSGQVPVVDSGSAIHWKNSVQWITLLISLILIHWIAIYRSDSASQHLNNWGLYNRVKGAVSWQYSSFCLILPITRPQSLWNLK